MEIENEEPDSEFLMALGFAVSGQSLVCRIPQYCLQVAD